jgi:uncharacterized protein YndB with AHSA1/START domain
MSSQAGVRIEGAGVLGEVEIAAPPERVFEALTEPEKLCAWWGSEESYRVSAWRSELRVGGAWEATGLGAGGGEFRVHGRFVAIEPPRRLAYTWNPSWLPDSPETTVSYELRPHRGGTLLEVRHEGFAGDAAARDDHLHGWPAVLGWLVAYCQGGPGSAGQGGNR